MNHVNLIAYCDMTNPKIYGKITCPKIKVIVVGD